MAKKAAAKQAKSNMKSTKAAANKPAATKLAVSARTGGKPEKKVSQETTSPAAEPLMHRLDALLHTIRTIAQHEDELCTLLHDVRSKGKVSKPLLRELQTLLAVLPAAEYTHDLFAVSELTGEV
ncbi:MAG: hypothetical protein ACRYF4_03040 [Janthinobacterium lividum]